MGPVEHWYENQRSSFQQFSYLHLTTLLFLVGWLLDSYLGITFIRAMSGLVLLSFFPGYYFLRLVRFPLSEWRWYGQLSLALLSSMTLLAVIQFGTRHVVPFTEASQSALSLLAPWILFTLVAINNAGSNDIQKIVSFLREWRQRLTLGDQWKQHLILLTPLLIYIVTYLINPTVDNADGYLDTLTNAIKLQQNPAAYPRFFFVPVLGLYRFVTDLPLVFVFKTLLSVSFYLSYFMLFNYLEMIIKDRKYIWLAYLAVLAAPVIVTEVNIIRPQLMVMIYCLPIIILLIEGLRKNFPLYLVVATGFSLILTGFHELGSILVALSLFGLFYYIARRLLVHKDLTISAKQIILSLLFIYPYAKLYNLFELFLPTLNTARNVLSHIDTIQWRWWFIDNYTTIDGFNVGWPGIQAFHYYLYNGLLFLISSLLLFSAQLKNRHKMQTVLLSLPAVYAAIYFCFAEILPRLGIFYLPNRAWPHFMLGLILCFGLSLAVYTGKGLLGRLLVASLGFSIVVGTVASLYLTYDKVGTVFRGELGAAKFIRETLPENSVVVSTQPNYDLVKFYGNRQFAGVDLRNTPVHFADDHEFSEKLQTLIAKFEEVEPPYIIPEQVTVTQQFSGETLLSTSRTITAPAKKVIPEAVIEPGDHVYFLYSFAKLRGLNAKRPYNQVILDKENLDYFLARRTKDIVYRDNNAVIIKIR